MQQTIPWIIALAAVGLVVLAAVGLALRARRMQRRALPTEWSLASRPVFSAEERAVYRQLREALPHHVVLSKLPLVRFCQPNDPEDVRYWYDLLGGIHVGFALCSANGRVLAAIDLEGDRPGSRRALEIKQAVLQACQVRYLRCSAATLPSIPELQLLVPQNANGRGPLAAPALSAARTTLATTVASKRKERDALWHDSSFFHDSFLAGEPRQETPKDEPDEPRYGGAQR